VYSGKIKQLLQHPCVVVKPAAISGIGHSCLKIKFLAELIDARVCYVSRLVLLYEPMPMQWLRANFDPPPYIRNGLTDLKLITVLEDYPHAKFDFDPTTSVVLANTQVATARFLYGRPV